MKIVFDTNVLISAFVFKGASLQVYRYGLENAECYISAWILNELQGVLKDKFRFTELEVSQILALLKERLILSTPHTELPDICRDPDDNNILQLAESTYANYLITGDKDVLVLEDYKGIKILNPRRFLDEVIGKKE